MDFLSKFSNAPDVEAAVADLVRQYEGFSVSSLLYFASTDYDGVKVGALMRDAFPGVQTFGCTSNGEFTSLGLRQGGISTMAFSAGAGETAVAALAENIAGDPAALEKAFSTLEEKLGSKLMDLDFREHFGIILFDGRVPRMDKFIDRVGNLSDIIFIGGYASDDFSFSKIGVFMDGARHEGAAVLIVVRPGGRFKLLKTQSACPTGDSFIVTDADEDAKVIHTLDHRPALDVYAEALGLKRSELTPDVFLHNPFGIMAAGQPFVRTVSHGLDDGGMCLFFAAKAGMRLGLMKPADIVETTIDDLEAVRREFGSIRALLNFDCAHRALILSQAGKDARYSSLFAGIETSGFSTFGEAYIGQVNQTAVMAIFA